MSKPNTPNSFWAKVKKGNENECWNWQGALNSTGYGNISYQGVNVTAHRVAYSLSKGSISVVAPEHGSNMFVLHTCDNRKCCNPNHLVLGTYSENQQQAYARNRRRQPKGEKHANAKLTAKQASDIRVRCSLGANQYDLAAEYDVSQSVISKITRGVSYV